MKNRTLKKNSFKKLNFKKKKPWRNLIRNNKRCMLAIRIKWPSPRLRKKFNGKHIIIVLNVKRDQVGKVQQGNLLYFWPHNPCKEIVLKVIFLAAFYPQGDKSEGWVGRRSLKIRCLPICHLLWQRVLPIAWLIRFIHGSVRKPI